MPEKSSSTQKTLFDLLISKLSEFVVVLMDTGGNFTSWHPGVERLFGYTAEEFRRQNLEVLLPPEDRLKGVTARELKSAAENGRASDTRWLVDKSGRRVFVEGITIALRGRDGSLLAFGKVLRDVTEKKHADDRLKSMSLELERSNEELVEFARIASHDLSAPIISARWLVDSLSKRHAGQLDAEGRKCLEQISRNLEGMADLIQGVLVHAQVGTSAISSPDSIPADQALAAAVQNLRGGIEESGAIITQGQLAAEVCIRPQPLTQLFQNLLSNAIKYKRPDASPAIEVTVARQGSMWLFGIRDNGIGIEPDWIDRIFQPSQRRHAMEIAGSGIGLATCKKIVTRAGGEIWAESRVGSGSTFFFTLPGPAAPPENEATRPDGQAGSG